MNGMQTRKLNRFQRLNRRFTLNPLMRTRLIWWGRIWIINLIHVNVRIIEGVIKAIAKLILIIIAALFLV
jgi:hypothetical protein